MKPLRLQEIVDVELLERMIAEHYVKVTQDPRTGLSIYNYTARAQYSQEWNEATLSCRGLIVDAAGHVVARPFPKFFNQLTHEVAQFVLDELLGRHLFHRQTKCYNFASQVFGVGQVALRTLAVLLELHSIAVVLAVLSEQD
jgi:hypothetical protein